MGFGDPAHHGQAQPGPAAAARRVRLPEPLPDMVQVFRRDADAVVRHHGHRRVPFPAQGQFQPPAGAAVADAVLQQVDEQPHQQRFVPLHRHARLDPGAQFDAPRGGLLGLGLGHHGGQFAQVHRFPRDGLPPLVRPGQQQQLGQQRRHLPRPGMDGFQRRPGLLRVPGVRQRVLALGQDHRHRRAQLVGCVVGELLFPGEGVLQPGEHGVEFPGQRVDLVPAFPQADAAGQVAPRADLPRRPGDLPHRAESPPGQQVAAHRRQRHEHRQHQQRRAQQGGQGAVHGIGGGHGAHPQRAVLLHLDLLVVKVPDMAVALHRAQFAAGKHGGIVKAARHEAVQRHALFVVHRQVHPVVEALQVPVDLQFPVPGLDLAAAGRRHGLHAGQLALAGVLGPGKKQEPQRDGRQQHHEQRVEQRDPPGDGPALHGSSRST